jgi:hypothetical protein
MTPYDQAVAAVERGDVRAVDAIVAEHVMGWKWTRFAFVWDAHPKEYLFPPDGDVDRTTGGNWERVDDRWILFDMPAYSEDIAAAWEVRAVVKDWIFSKRLTFKRELQWAISRRMGIGSSSVLAADETLLQVEPADICLAVLKTVVG